MDSVIQFEGTIYEDGYGLLAQKVMRDKNLPRQSKLIYAYMCAFAGVNKDGERTAFPSVELQCNELDMTENTYYKWRKPLIDYGYIKINKQRDENSKFERNIYSIVAVPKERVIEINDNSNLEKEEEKPYPKNYGMDEKPYPKNYGAVEKALNQPFDPYRNSSCTVKPCMVNEGTNSNILNINKDIDTKDTLDTREYFSENMNNNEIREKYIKQAFYGNQEKVPKELANAFDVFCRTIDEAGMYYKSINHAKLDVFKNALDYKDIMLFDLMQVENNPELLQKIINAFVRVIRMVEREGNIQNPAGYLYKAVYKQIWDYYDLDNIKNVNENRA